MEPDERMMARLKAGCICKGVKLIRLIEAIEQGAATVADVQQACGIGDGACNGKRCGEKIRQLLASPKASASTEDEFKPQFK